MDVKHERKEKEITETVIFTWVCFNVILFNEIFLLNFAKKSNLFFLQNICLLFTHERCLFTRKGLCINVFFPREKVLFTSIKT